MISEYFKALEVELNFFLTDMQDKAVKGLQGKEQVAFERIKRARIKQDYLGLS